MTKCNDCAHQDVCKYTDWDKKDNNGSCTYFDDLDTKQYLLENIRSEIYKILQDIPAFGYQTDTEYG